MKEGPWEIGQVYTTQDGVDLIVSYPETDGSGCMVCDGCYFRDKEGLKCPNCRGPMVWIDYAWGVIFEKKPIIVKKERKMKKLILIILAILTLSCSSKKVNGEGQEYTIVYKVYYPENTVQKEYSFIAYYIGSYDLISFGGSNDLTISDRTSEKLNLYHFCKTIESTTAPIEIISFGKTEKKGLYQDNEVDN